jgi:hypothetical protein
MWRSSCRVCEEGALFDTEAEAVDALGEHMAFHNLRTLNDRPSSSLAVPQPAQPTMNLLIDERTGKTGKALAHLPAPGDTDV